MGDDFHVHRDGELRYCAVLKKVDIVADVNSFYILQLLKADTFEKYWVFRKWGRTATHSCGKRLLCFYEDLEGAKKFFKKIFEKMTGNFFGISFFIKYPGKYYQLDIDYDEEQSLKSSLEMTECEVKSKLPESVQNLIKLLFDVNEIKKTMKAFHLDLEKMPLGKVSQEQLKDAAGVLKDIYKSIQFGGSSTQFAEKSNCFYTLIPHDFGIQRPPIIDTIEQVFYKFEMLQNLMEMKVVDSLLTDDSDDNTKSPIDRHYEQLQTEIEVVPRDSEEFALIEEYVENTHGPTHTNFELEILDIFRVMRKSEKRQHRRYEKLHNRQLLWHGSRLTNWVGILSNGLKIAPPEAKEAGYMFGKGIYFADMVSKSANYCHAYEQDGIGLLLLCQCALGNTLDCYRGKYVEELPEDKHSTKGIGKTYPNPIESHIRPDGVEVPKGKPFTDPNIQSTLLYNEYIVYDPAQVKFEYLLKMKFNYKR